MTQRVIPHGAQTPMFVHHLPLIRCRGVGLNLEAHSIYGAERVELGLGRGA